MKRLFILLTALSLSFSALQAKERDYKVNVKNMQNNITVGISSKTVPVRNATVKLKIYQDNNNISTYKTKKVTRNNQYIFNTDNLTSGTYNYLLSFNRVGGMTHYKRGKISLQ